MPRAAGETEMLYEPFPVPGAPEQHMFGRVVQVAHLADDCPGWILDHWLESFVARDGDRHRTRAPDPMYAPCPVCRPGRRAQWEAGYRDLRGTMDQRIGPERARAYVIYAEAEMAAGHALTDAEQEWLAKARQILGRASSS